MEKMSDFFSELKERISNPFIFSYLFAWCIWNYQIVVGLIFYKVHELKIDGYNSYLDLILCNSSTWKFFWLPLFSALGYTFLFPFFKNIILAFGVWMDTWGGNLNLVLSKNKKIPVDEFLKIKADYSTALEKVVSYSKSEAEFNTKVAEIQSERAELIKEFNRLKLESKTEKDAITDEKRNALSVIEKWENYNSLKLLDGDWNLETHAKDFVGKSTAVIAGGVIEIKDRDTTVSWRITQLLSNFRVIIVFMKHLNLPDSPEKMWRLSTNPTLTELEGINTDRDRIRLKKNTK
jgi:hypothetical protein